MIPNEWLCVECRCGMNRDGFIFSHPAKPMSFAYQHDATVCPNCGKRYRVYVDTHGFLKVEEVTQ